jgi:hypothetical protein
MTETTPQLPILTEAQWEIVANGTLVRGRIQAVPSHHAAALQRKGYATLTYRHTSNGYLVDVALTRAGRAIRRAAAQNGT